MTPLPKSIGWLSSIRVGAVNLVEKKFLCDMCHELGTALFIMLECSSTSGYAYHIHRDFCSDNCMGSYIACLVTKCYESGTEVYFKESEDA